MIQFFVYLVQIFIICCAMFSPDGLGIGVVEPLTVFSRTMEAGGNFVFIITLIIFFLWALGFAHAVVNGAEKIVLDSIEKHGIGGAYKIYGNDKMTVKKFFNRVLIVATIIMLIAAGWIVSGVLVLLSFPLMYMYGIEARKTFKMIQKRDYNQTLETYP